MALKLLNYTCQKTGVIFPEAYVKVVSVDVNNFSNFARLEVHVFFNQYARDTGKRAVDARSISATTENNYFQTYFAPNVLASADVNPFTKAYQYLKTLPEYADAVDIV